MRSSHHHGRVEQSHFHEHLVTRLVPVEPARPHLRAAGYGSGFCTMPTASATTDPKQLWGGGTSFTPWTCCRCSLRRAGAESRTAGGAPPGAAEPAAACGAAAAWLRDFSMLCEFTRGGRDERRQRHDVKAGYYALHSLRGLPVCIRGTGATGESPTCSRSTVNLVTVHLKVVLSMFSHVGGRTTYTYGYSCRAPHPCRRVGTPSARG